MGYVGEAVVACWLRKRFPEPEYEVVSQIKPTAVPASGGPYLVLGILTGGKVEAVFEVKSQDYIFDGGVNLALAFLWKHRGEAVEFALQDGPTLMGHEGTSAFLVLLVPPNDYGLDAIGKRNLRNVLLFQDIWKDLGKRFSAASLQSELHADVEKVLGILQRPSKADDY